MKRTHLHAPLAAALLSLVACASSSPDPDSSAGPMAGSAGTTPFGTGGSGGGAPSQGGTTGGLPAASGAAGSAGSVATTGGATQGGGAGASTGGGGASAGGGADSNGGSGGGTAREVKPSAGCARQSTDVTIPNSLLGKPPGYDGKTPVPAVIAFHAAGNDNTSMERTFKNSDLAKKYFMVYPNSSGNGWNMQADKGRYQAAYDGLLSQACVDENRIYATGHSSGAQMVVQLLCSGDANFDAVAPVASSVYCQKWKNGPVPALIIHGVQDTERQAYGLNDGNGQKDLQPYLTSNMCEMSSTPFDPDLSNCGNVNNGIDNKPFDDGCREFSGCSAKTLWCNHNDPQYGTSNHGIPCFGVRAIYDFFESLQ